jgi:hypothetical protein
MVHIEEPEGIAPHCPFTKVPIVWKFISKGFSCEDEIIDPWEITLRAIFTFGRRVELVFIRFIVS